MFVFHHPQDYAKKQKEEKGKKKEAKPVETITFESAQEEIAKNAGLNKLTGSINSKGKTDIYYAIHCLAVKMICYYKRI